MAPLTLFTAATPNGRKVSIALTELNLIFDAVCLDIEEGDTHTPAFLALNPAGKIPVLKDGGQVIWESGAILHYLCETYDSQGVLLPKSNDRARISAQQFSYYQASALGPILGQFFAVRRRNPESDLYHELHGKLVGILDVLERVLEDGRPYIADTYTYADIMFYPWLWYLENQAFDAFMERSNLCRWMATLAERPAIRTGMRIPAPA